MSYANNVDNLWDVPEVLVCGPTSYHPHCYDAKKGCNSSGTSVRRLKVGAPGYHSLGCPKYYRPLRDGKHNIGGQNVNVRTEEYKGKKYPGLVPTQHLCGKKARDMQGCELFRYTANDEVRIGKCYMNKIPLERNPSELNLGHTKYKMGERSRCPRNSGDAAARESWRGRHSDRRAGKAHGNPRSRCYI